MKYKSYKIILMVAVGVFSSFSFASAKSFTIFNATNVNQPYFSVNGVTGNVGIGTNNPAQILDIYNSAGPVINLNNHNNSSALSANAVIGVIKADNNYGENHITRATTAGAASIEFLNGSTNWYNGQIAFKTNGGDSTVTLPTERMRIDSSGNVGIGTTTPDYKLRVQGTGYFTNTVVVGEPTSLTHAATRSYVDTMIAGGSGSTVGYWTLNNNNLYASSTAFNVGIGTTSPLTKLDINGSLRATTGVFTGSDYASGLISGQANVVNYVLNNTTGRLFAYDGISYYDFAIGDWGGGNPNIMLKVGGNVGINRGSPVYKLDVAGTLRTDNGANFATVSGNVGVGTTGPVVKLHVAGALTGNEEVLRIAGGDGNTGSAWIGFSQSNDSGWNTARIGVAHRNLSYSGDLTFSTNNGTLPSDVTEKMRIQYNGNVGIGTVSPSRQLDIRSTGAGLYVSGAGVSPYTQRIAEFAYAGNGNSIIIKALGGTAGITTSAGIALNFSTEESATQMTLTTAGNVGIGTTTPDYKLRVQDMGYFTNTVVVGEPTSPTHAATRSYVDTMIAGGSGSTVGYWTLNNNNLYASSTAFNVGIGTTNPLMKLDVYNPTTATGDQNIAQFRRQRVANDGNWDGLTITGDGVGVGGIIKLISSGSNSQNMGLGPTGSELYIQRVTGNVGIGATNPSQLFEVKKNQAGSTAVRITNINNTANDFPELQLENGNGQISGFRQNSGNGGVAGFGGILDTTIYNTYNSAVFGGLAFSTHNGTSQGVRMYINTMGNVGIGTASPAYNLAVYGGDAGDGVTEIRGGESSGARLRLIADQGDDVTNADHFQINHLINNNVEFQRFDGSGWVGKMVLDSSGNIGIGTTTPDFKLRVHGDSYFTNTVVVGEPTSPTHAATRSYVDTMIAGGSGSTVGYWTLNNNNLYASSTAFNVGIGTTAPVGKLDVVSSANEYTSKIINTYANPTGAAGLLISGTNNNTDIAYGSNRAPSLVIQNTNGTANTYGNISFMDAGGNSVAGINGLLQDDTNNQGALAFFVRPSAGSATEAIRIASTGNVGVGTTNPIYNVDVLNATSATPTYSRVGLDVTTSTSFPRLQFGSLGSYIGYDYSGNEAMVLNPRYINSVIKFQIAGTEKVRIDKDGNVGIGTTTPGENLSIVGASTDADLSLQAGPTTYSSYKFLMRSQAADLGLYMEMGGTKFLKAYGYNNADSIRLGSLGYEDTVTLSGGNVGIGTTGPVDKLTILKAGAGEQTQLRLWNSNGAVPDTASLKFSVEAALTAYGKGALIFERTLSYGRGSLHFAMDNTADGSDVAKADAVMTIQNDGNVGIGSTTPNYKLRVQGTGYFANPVVVGAPTDASHAATRDYVDTAISGVVASSSVSSQWTTNGTSIYYNTGNVGIGAVTPGSKLHVVGTAVPNFDKDNYSTSVIEDTDGRFEFVSNDSGSNGAAFILTDAVGAADNRKWFFGAGTSADSNKLHIGYSTSLSDVNPAGSSMFVITTSGNIGMATSAPSTKLEVVGTIKASAFSGASFAGTINANNVSAGEFAKNSSGGNFIFGATVGGNVGIGTTNPGAKLEVLSTTEQLRLSYDGSHYSKFTVDSGGDLNYTTVGTGDEFDFWNGYTGAAYVDIGQGGSSEKQFRMFNGSSVVNRLSSTGDSFITAGNVGIGTTDPGSYKLKVAGDVAITGNLYTQTGADFAEEFIVNDTILPGSVVVIGNLGYKSAKACSSEYDTTVVGVVSDNPSIVAGTVVAKKKAVVAMVGVVSVNVNDSNGNIRKGDLLTTSAISGQAMKARREKTGTIIGKALEDLNGGSGKIKALVNLQ